MFKLVNICPKCLAPRARVKMGGGGYVENGFLKVAEDLGEIYECPCCGFVGSGIIEGNASLLSLLRARPAPVRTAQKAAAPKPVAAKPRLHPKMRAGVNPASTRAAMAAGLPSALVPHD